MGKTKKVLKKFSEIVYQPKGNLRVKKVLGKSSGKIRVSRQHHKSVKEAVEKYHRNLEEESEKFE